MNTGARDKERVTYDIGGFSLQLESVDTHHLDNEPADRGLREAVQDDKSFSNYWTKPRNSASNFCKIGLMGNLQTWKIQAHMSTKSHKCIRTKRLSRYASLSDFQLLELLREGTSEDSPVESDCFEWTAKAQASETILKTGEPLASPDSLIDALEPASPENPVDTT